MQVILLVAFLVVASLAKGQQLWNDRSNGITIKTLYVPLRKGSSSIPIPDFSRIKPLTTLSLPNFPVVADLQQASTYSQDISPKGNAYESNAQPLQDVRAKPNNQPLKAEWPSQAPNPNFYHGSNFHQQQYNNEPHQSVENSVNPHIQSQQQFYQPEPMSHYGGGHLPPLRRNHTVAPHSSNGFPNGNFVPQDSHQNRAGNNIPGPMSFGQQTYAPENVSPQKNQASNHLRNFESQAQSYHRGNGANQDGVPPQNAESNFSGESPRYFHQMSTDTAPAQQAYVSPPTENQSYMPSHHHMNYANQNMPNNQNLDSSIRSFNPFQGLHNQENRQILNNQQQPVNTYAIVHQRVPANNFEMQGNRAKMQSEQSHTPYNPASGGKMLSSHGTYINNEPREFMKTSPNQERFPIQVASQNHLKLENHQNALVNSQYPPKHFTPGNVDGFQYNGQPLTTHVQFMIPQHSQGQPDPSEDQYFNQPLGHSGANEVQNQDRKSNQPHNSAHHQVSYPDPTSETFYPEHRQVYVAPPADYTSQGHQPPANEQGFVRYSASMESNGHNSQVPAEQIGIHVNVPNRSYAYRDSPRHSNAHA